MTSALNLLAMGTPAGAPAVVCPDGDRPSYGDGGDD
jgi:hypothetical protein